MNFEEKCQFAVKELDNAKIWKSNYNPPLIKLLHKLGFKIPYPHYNSFIRNAVFTGLFFGVTWGILMYLFLWKSESMFLKSMATTASFAGILFGLCMASYYRYGFKKYRLTPWSEMKKV